MIEKLEPMWKVANEIATRGTEQIAARECFYAKCELIGGSFLWAIATLCAILAYKLVVVEDQEEGAVFGLIAIVCIICGIVCFGSAANHYGNYLAPIPYLFGK